MATTRVSYTPPPKRRLALTIVIALLSVLLILFVAADIWFFHASKAALPQLDGSLQLQGLHAPVSIERDDHGVPTITAANLDDLFYAQGYVTAQDRLWQMDISRRFSSGDLAVVFGPALVKHDIRQRTFGMRQMAEQSAQQLTPRDREYLQSYADGVNAYIAQHQKTLPLEFRLLTYFPHAWTPVDSILVGLSMYQYLNGYEATTKLLREKVTSEVGPELAADLYVNGSWRDHPPGTEDGEIENTGPTPPTETEEESRQPGKHEPHAGLQSLRDLFPDEAAMQPGSNNWVVSGAHTATGKPLLANDMHLQHHLPNTWFMAHLVSGDFDVAGVTLPGFPFVIVGHNRRIAWGFTNLGPEVEDLYVENFNANGEYQTPQGWVQPQHRHEIIRVKGGPEVNLDVAVTRHGPIITDLIPHETRKLALKWTAADPNALTLPFFDVDSAQNWPQFLDAFSKFGGPGQNVVYADVDGHIGYHATGKIPIRASGDGALPVPGSDDAHEWTGYIPFDKLPNVFDPPSGIIGTANGKITPDGYPYLISNEWETPYRTQRIYKVLSANKKFSAADMLALQMDVHSEYDKFIADRLVYAVDHNPKASQRAREAADVMRKWNGNIDKEAVAPTIEIYARRLAFKKIIASKLGDVRDYDWMMNSVWFENVLSKQPPRWLPKEYASYDDLLAAAVEGVVNGKEAPHVLTLWKYGRAFPVEIEHPFWSHVPILKKFADVGPVAKSGDEYTVKAAGRDYGASERMTVDLSNLDASTLNIVNGQSGHVFSPYYNDQWAAYDAGTTFPWPFSEDAIRSATKHRLTLEPAQ